MKGIIFSEPMFLATIEGRKTQTRRIMKPQPEEFIGGDPCVWREDLDELINEDGGHWQDVKPRYKPGEIVALKESYFGSWDECAWEEERKYKEFECIDDLVNSPGWSNKMLTKSEYMRYFIKITAVRAERLQDISDEDCFAEGIVACKDSIGMPDGYHWEPDSNFQYLTPREAYSALIDKINGKGTWDSNPFVWIYDYELTEKPE